MTTGLHREELLSCVYLLTSCTELPGRDRTSCYDSSCHTTVISSSSYMRCAAFCLLAKCAVVKYQQDMCEMTMPSSGPNQIVRPRNSLVKITAGFEASGSSVYADSLPNKIFDGDMMTMFHSDESDLQPWLLIDLKACVPFLKLRLYPYTDSYFGDRFRSTKIAVSREAPPTAGDFSQFTEIGRIPGLLATATIWHEFEAAECVHYIAIHKYEALAYPNNIMFIAEVELHIPQM